MHKFPKNRSSSSGVVGTGNRLIASTLYVGIEIPRESTTCPRNVSDGSPSWHLFLLRRSPLSLSLWKRHCKSLTWSSLHLLPTIESSCKGSERTACRLAVGARCVGNIGRHY